MTKCVILDTENAGEVADQLLALLEEEGWTVAEAIPGLAQAIILLASEFGPQTQQALDEVTDLIVDAAGGM